MPSRRGRGGLGRRLTLLGVLTSGGSLVIASVAFLAFEAVRAERQSLQRTALLADITASNSAAALSFEDATTAAEALDALSADPALELACLYRSDGSVFVRAVWTAAEPGCPPPVAELTEAAEGRLRVFRRVVLAGDPVGWIHLRSASHSVGQRLSGYGVIVAGVLACSILFSLGLSARLQRRISDPLVALTESSATIAAGDLSQPPAIGGDDEIGLLARSFGYMSERLRDLVARVTKSAASVRELSAALGIAKERASVAAGQEAEAVEQVRSSGLRMESSASELNQRAESVSQATERTSAEIQSMGTSIENVATMMDSLYGTVESTVSSIDQLSASIDSIGGSIEQLRTTTSSSIAALEEEERGSVAAGKLASETEVLAQEMLEASGGGRVSVEKTVLAMAAINQQFDDIQKIVAGLSKSSSAIEDIVSVIREFAEGSRLLALNAKIIAAQAGEHGRSFAVVAREVDAFATRAGKSVNEIESLVQQVQGSTQQVVEAVERGAACVDEGVSRSRDAGRALSEIQGKALQSSERVQAISERTSAQTEQLGITQTEIGRLSQVVQEITRATHEQQNASKLLAKNAEEVYELCGLVQSAATEQLAGNSKITTAVREVGGTIKQTVLATQAQIDDVERIASAVEVLLEKAHVTREATREMDRIVEMLAGRASDLEGATEQFTL